MRIKYSNQVQDVLNSQNPDSSESEESSGSESSGSESSSSEDEPDLMSVAEMQEFLNNLNPEDLNSP